MLAHQRETCIFLLIFEEDYGTFAILFSDACQLQHFGVENIPAEGRYHRMVIFQPQGIDRLLIPVDHHHAHLQPTELLYQCFGYAVVAENQDKRLIHLSDCLGKPRFDDLLVQHLILYQCHYRTDTVKPPDHRQVDHERDPKLLLVGEVVRRLAKTDRRSHIADKIEGIEDGEMIDVTLGILPGDQHHPQYRDGKGDNDDQDRQPKPADHNPAAVVLHRLSLGFERITDENDH